MRGGEVRKFQVPSIKFQVAGGAEDGEQGPEVLRGGRFIERDPDGARVDRAEVDPVRPRGGVDGVSRGAGRQLDPQRVENRCGVQAVARRAQAPRQRAGQRPHAARDAAQAGRAVIDGVHGRHHRQQHLGRADVGGGLVAPDVLLARAQGEAEGRAAAGILRHANEAAGHLPLQRIARRKIRRVRPAEPHRHPEALRRADRDVGAEFAGRPQQGEG